MCSESTYFGSVEQKGFFAVHMLSPLPGRWATTPVCHHDGATERR